MTTLDPQFIGLLVSLMTVTTAMLLLDRGLNLLEERRPERCAACGRLVERQLRLLRLDPGVPRARA